ncbi:MAG: acetyl-coenzyme A synthetase N-terminal domain-containing protein, partial [Albidovulum sp.]
MTYREVYASWKSDPEAFWMEAAKSIDWVKPPTKALFDGNAPLYEWFADAEVN